MKITVDLEALSRELEDMKTNIQEGVKAGLMQVAKDMEYMEKEFIAQTTGQGEYVPTGNLKRSVTIMPMEFSPNGTSITVTPYINYAIYVELGTGIYASNGGGRQDGWVYPIGGGQFRFTKGIPPHFFVQSTYEYFNDGKAKAIIEEKINTRL